MRDSEAELFSFQKEREKILMVKRCISLAMGSWPIRTVRFIWPAFFRCIDFVFFASISSITFKRLPPCHLNFVVLFIPFVLQQTHSSTWIQMEACRQLVQLRSKWFYAPPWPLDRCFAYKWAKLDIFMATFMSSNLFFVFGAIFGPYFANNLSIFRIRVVGATSSQTLRQFIIPIVTKLLLI